MFYVFENTKHKMDLRNLALIPSLPLIHVISLLWGFFGGDFLISSFNSNNGSWQQRIVVKIVNHFDKNLLSSMHL